LNWSGNLKYRTKTDSSIQAENAMAIGEQHLRNSAKYPCNFGKSGTSSKMFV